jgi:hypothetical protein
MKADYPSNKVYKTTKNSMQIVCKKSAFHKKKCAFILPNAHYEDLCTLFKKCARDCPPMKYAPMIRRASARRALMASRSRAALVARAAARRAPNAGHAWDARLGWCSREGRSRVRSDKFTSVTGAQGAAGAAGTGPPGSEGGPSGAGSQKATSMPPAAQAVGSVAAKVAHSLRQAGVGPRRSSRSRCERQRPSNRYRCGAERVGEWGTRRSSESVPGRSWRSRSCRAGPV